MNPEAADSLSQTSFVLAVLMRNDPVVGLQTYAPLEVKKGVNVNSFLGQLSRPRFVQKTAQYEVP